jgi:putative heme transporter
MAAYTTDVPATGEERVMPSTPAEQDQPGSEGTAAPEAGTDPGSEAGTDAAADAATPTGDVLRARAVEAVEASDAAEDAAEDASEAAAVAVEAADAARDDLDEVPLAQLLAPETDTDTVQVAHLDWRSGAWIAAGLFSSFLLIGLLRNTPASLTRIGVGVLLAFALDPVVVRIGQRLGISRAAAVGVVSLGVAAVFAFLVFVLGPPAIQQAEEFGRELPDTVEQAYTFPFVGGWLEDQNAAEEVRTWAEDLPGRVDTDSITEVARSVLDGVLAAVMVLVVGLAVLLDGDRLVGRLLAALPDNVEPGAVRVGRTFSRTLGAYFAGSLLVASLAAIFILAVGLAFGVPLAPAAALWMLVVNLIPQIGGFLGGSFFVILAVTQGLATGIICLVLFLVYQQFENHVIQPVVVGQAVDLSPPATMLAALVGGAAAGIPGALVATPLVGAGKSLYLELRWGRRHEHHGITDRVRLPEPMKLAERLRLRRKV